MLKIGDRVNKFDPYNNMKKKPYRIMEIKRDLSGEKSYVLRSTDPEFHHTCDTPEEFIFESDKFAVGLDLVDKEYQARLEKIRRELK